MLRNYLKVSFRTVIRHFTYSFVNILGLTLGLASVIVIGTWVYQEFSYDRHFDDRDKIFRIGVNFYNIGDMAKGPVRLENELKEYPKVSQVTRLDDMGKKDIIIDNVTASSQETFIADPQFFEVFSYGFLHGDRSDALKRPNTAVITHRASERLFGTSNSVGKTFTLDEKTYAITGVVDGNRPSHIPAELWISTTETSSVRRWLSASSYVYAKIDDPEPEIALENILADLMKEKIHPEIGNETPYEEWLASGIYKLLPMAITDIHLRSTMKFEISAPGNYQKTRIFAGIAVLILVLASINFVNVTTARASQRAKEVGIRKTLGTSRKQLVGQFLVESMVLFSIGSLLAILVAELFLEAFERITQTELLETLFVHPGQLIVISLASLALGLLAGIYPAFYITKYQPVRILKGTQSPGEKGVLRGGLVFFQFVISISLLVVSFFVYKQLSFIQNKDLGFDTSNVMIIRNLNRVSDHSDYLMQELRKLPEVSYISNIHKVPADNSLYIHNLKTEEMEKSLSIKAFYGDETTIPCLGYRLLDGRNFSADLATDSSAVLLNESAVKALALKEPIGARLNDGKFRVIGVVSDFNFESLQRSIQPGAIFLKENGPNLAIKFTGSDPGRLITTANELWDELNSEAAFSYYFLDENFERLVEKEKTLSKSLLLFNVLAMIISCLGLYGLSVFIVEQKVKEIGIRRVLGATIVNITSLLSGNFAKPIVLAFLVAAPISYFVVDRWLLDYAYRVSIDPWLFILSGVLALLIGLITVSWKTVRTALQNPVNSLRDE